MPSSLQFAQEVRADTRCKLTYTIAQDHAAGFGTLVQPNTITSLTGLHRLLATETENERDCTHCIPLVKVLVL